MKSIKSEGVDEMVDSAPYRRRPGSWTIKHQSALSIKIGLKFLVDVNISAIFASDPQFTSTEGNVSFKNQCFMPNERSHFVIPNTIVASVSAFGSQFRIHSDFLIEASHNP
ncbi:hypothetical protein OUZ56_020445 [Daphnia magna]|uniref:Uncharacterized protein n=1 Tax=Daphnia magna TaxID=35525 RepID=A0ABQ9ZES0_9CRUS|nr:hypothetical protein OUZ56_020445 [Daphnia magna]